MMAEATGWAVAALLCVLVAVQWRVRTVGLEAVARACHELRGPLTAARLGLELGERPGEVSAERLRAIDVELERAGLALDDLSVVPARRAIRLRGVGARRWARARTAPRSTAGGAGVVNVRGVVGDSVEAWQAAAAAGGSEIRLRWDGPEAWVRGDRLRLAQATGNLIANAIEHGRGSIEVRGRVDGASVRIEVIDDGVGLPAPVANLARRPRRGRGRRGRGLAIALAAAEAQGGRLAAAPSERGARLVLELPVAPATIPSPAAAAPHGPAGGPGRPGGPGGPGRAGGPGGDEAGP